MRETVDFLNTTAKKYFGLDYLFPWQRLVISNILEGCGYFKTAQGGGEAIPAEDIPRRQIAILPTGAGKSLCFMLPGVLLEGVTLILFPLLSLLSDQKRRLEEQGIAAELIAGGMSREDRDEAWKRLGSGRSRFLLSNPETLIQPASLRRIVDLPISHFVIDEAHTIPDWGAGFRPALMRIPEIVEAAGPGMLSAFTATASDTILESIQNIIFKEEPAHVIRANPDRPNITYHVVPVLSKKRELRRLLGGTCETGGPAAPQNPQGTSAAANPLRLPRPVLIFCGSRNTAEETASFLRSALGEEEVFFYHAGLSRREKKKTEEWFFNSNTGILAATTAYGMGVDKKNIRTVLHLDISRSVEAFLQESGRGGRDGKPAFSVLLMPLDTLRNSENRRSLDGVSPGSVPQKSKGEERRERLVRALTDRATCVREGLLREMGSEPEFCSGCDVCGNSRPLFAEGEREILHFFRYSRFRYRRDRAAIFLRGPLRTEHTPQTEHRSRAGHSREKRIGKVPADIPGAGILYSWTTKEISEAIETLLRAGSLKKPRRGPWRGLIGTPMQNNRAR